MDVQRHESPPARPVPTGPAAVSGSSGSGRSGRSSSAGSSRELSGFRCSAAAMLAARLARMPARIRSRCQRCTATASVAMTASRRLAAESKGSCWDTNGSFAGQQRPAKEQLTRWRTESRRAFQHASSLGRRVAAGNVSAATTPPHSGVARSGISAPLPSGAPPLHARGLTRVADQQMPVKCRISSDSLTCCGSSA